MKFSKVSVPKCVFYMIFLVREYLIVAANLIRTFLFQASRTNIIINFLARSF